jgi:serine/threonine-protein phosphatase 2A regulatory subunit B''
MKEIDIDSDIVLHHPGLQFLSSLPLFQEKYVETVMCRIFYTINRSWDFKITLQELKKSNFVATLRMVEENEDINKVRLCRSFNSVS